MKDSKYYTPSIEEFYVGFEYESDLTWEINKDSISLREGTFDLKPKSTGIWEKKKFSSFQSANPLMPRNGSYYNYEKAKQHFRVKCLEREDIESLGFIQTEDRIAGYYHFEMKPAFKEINYKGEEIKVQKYFGIYLSKKDFSFILIYGGNFNSAHPNTDAYRFKGYCKNKSELKRLLKQLGING